LWSKKQNAVDSLQFAAGSRQRLASSRQMAGKNWSKGGRRTYKNPNSKHQITNKFQIPILNDQNKFGPPQADWSL
jgi:hypothetical protein